MHEILHTSVEARVADLEKRLNNDLWVTNRSFWKRTAAVYGHYLLGSLVISAVVLLFVLFVMIMTGIFAAGIRG